MNLDERARQAAAGLKATVAASPVSSPMPGVARWEWIPRALAAVGTAAAIVVVAILTIQLAPQTPSPVTQPPDSRVLPEFIPPVEDLLPTTDTTEPATTTSVHHSIAPSGTQGSAVPGEVPVVDTEAPVLIIGSPENGQVFESDVVRFSGSTEPGAMVRAGRYEADVASDGTWSIVLVLSPGSNRALFTATDEAGNEATAQVIVDYKPPVKETTTTTKPREDTTTTTKADVVEFSANQVYGTCPSSPPFDVFWGTAQPGSKVTVTSDYGSGSVVANAEGGWELRVEFPEAPADVFFLVTAKSVATGRTKSFEFAYQP